MFVLYCEKMEAMRMVYKTGGVCSREILLDVKDGIINDVSFAGGCNGNLKAISILVKGKKAEDVIAELEGLRCGNRLTSCADQLTKALRKAIGKD